MKKIFTVILVMALWCTVFAACAPGEPVQLDAQASAQIPNPWTDAKDSAEVEKATGLAISALPEGAEDVHYSMVVGEKLAQIRFLWKGDEYTYRMMPGKVDQTTLSGLYVEFEKTEEMAWEDYPYTISYNEGKEGLSTWYDELTDVTYSVTMQSGADQKKLTAISECLIPAG